MDSLRAGRLESCKILSSFLPSLLLDVERSAYLLPSVCSEDVAKNGFISEQCDVFNILETMITQISNRLRSTVCHLDLDHCNTQTSNILDYGHQAEHVCERQRQAGPKS